MTTQRSDKAPLTTYFISALKGTGICIIVAAALLFAFSGIAYSTEDPNALTEPLGYTALYISAFVAGAVGSRTSGRSDLGAVIAGGLSGIFLLLILVFMSVIPAEAPIKHLPVGTVVLMYGMIPLTSVVSGFLLRRRQKRSRRRRRR